MKANKTYRTLIFIFSLMLIATAVKSQGTTHTSMGPPLPRDCIA